MSDIVERLREAADAIPYVGIVVERELVAEAAEVIELLQTVIEVERNAMKMRLYIRKRDGFWAENTARYGNGRMRREWIIGFQ